MNAISKLIALAALLLTGSQALAAVTEDEVSDAYYRGDTDALESLHATLDRNVPEDAFLAAYLDWRLGSLYMGFGNEKAADASLKRGQTALESLLEDTPTHAEAWALLSATIGMRIGIAPVSRGIRYGATTNSAMNKAVALAPNNPRVLLLDAIGKLNKPSMFGGNKTAAVDGLNRSLEVFAATGTGDYHWGEADAYVWRGLALQRAGENDAATADFERALAIEPDYTWAEQLRSNAGGQ